MNSLSFCCILSVLTKTPAMASPAVSCILKGVTDTSIIVVLFDNVKMFLGRNVDTPINDTNLSRQQVAVTAHYKNYSVSVETLGRNYSGCNGYALRKGSTYSLTHGDHLELLLGKHVFKVKFDPPAPESEDYETESSFSDVGMPQRSESDWDSNDFGDSLSLSVLKRKVYTNNDNRPLPKRQKVFPPSNNLSKKPLNNLDADADDNNAEYAHTFPLSNIVSKKLLNEVNSDEDDTKYSSGHANLLPNITSDEGPSKLSSEESKQKVFPLFNLVSKKLVHKTGTDEEECTKDFPVSKKSSDSAVWQSIESGTLLIYTSPDVSPSSKVAAFDLDGTLIRTKSGCTFPKDSNDWIINFPEIPMKLKELCDNGYKIVIFTNQAALSRDYGKVSKFKAKSEAVERALNIPFQMFVATVKKTIYRKPAVGMWLSLYNEMNGNTKIDLSKSFFVGDAAGREQGWALKKKKDHSACDRWFATNIGINFFTPEEYFLKAPAAPYLPPKFDPKMIMADLDLPIVGIHQEVILMVGSQASGKSFYCKKNLKPKGYVLVNRDTLGSWQACIKLMEASLQNKQSVVIDNTNGDKASRGRYTAVANKFNVPIRCFVMDVSLNHAKHNIIFRELTDKYHLPISSIILNSYMKNYEEPTLSEGFSEIVKVNFVPEFDNKEEEQLYNMYLLE